MVDALWAACQERTAAVAVPSSAAPGPMFFREPLLRLSGEDPSELVHQTLIPLAAAFLDRGEAQWTMPDRMQGFYLVWEDIMTAGLVVRPAWSRQLGRRIRAHQREGYDAEHEVLSLLDELGIADDELEEYVTQTLLHLAGWGGDVCSSGNEQRSESSKRAYSSTSWRCGWNSMSWPLSILPGGSGSMDRFENYGAGSTDRWRGRQTHRVPPR